MKKRLRPIFKKLLILLFFAKYMDSLNLRPDEQGIERADLPMGRYFFSAASRFCFCLGEKGERGLEACRGARRWDAATFFAPMAGSWGFSPDQLRKSYAYCFLIIIKRGLFALYLIS